MHQPEPGSAAGPRPTSVAGPEATSTSTTGLAATEASSTAVPATTGVAATVPLRVGVVGVGVGASQLLPALTSSPHIRLTAAADVRAAALEHFAREFGCPTFSSVEALCEDADVEAVWIATPNHLHAQHVIAAAERGKHVIVSKPMAVTLAEAEAMNAAAERHGVRLLAGHTQSMAPTIRKMADVVHGGELGKLGMVHTWHYTDWMYRPRLPAELDVSLGGGPVFRQASHQVDIVRYIAGGRVRSVRAQTVQLDAERGAAGAYTAYLEFESGTPATIVYSGYGHFAMGELLGPRVTGAHVAAHHPPPAAHKASQPPVTRGVTPAVTRGVTPSTAVDEAARKEALRYSGGAPSGGSASNSLGLFGLTLVTCERGDLRESPDGLFLYQRVQLAHLPVADELRGAAELEELYQAVRFGSPIVHDGRWGEATLEVCLAIHESARTRAEVQLLRQTALPV
jgi:phthalate 4,5-cis-dihydrodiol dehydrogenase